jgi:hypothetical protein
MVMMSGEEARVTAVDARPVAPVEPDTGDSVLPPEADHETPCPAKAAPPCDTLTTTGAASAVPTAPICSSPEDTNALI